MTWATTVANINTQLSAVTGIGQVINYASDQTRHEDVVAELVSGSILNGAMIRRESYSERQSGGSGYRFIGKHTVKVTVVYSKKQDGSKQASFDALLDAIAAKLRSNNSVFLVQPEDGSEAVDITPISDRMFGNMLVHHAEVRFVVEEVFET